MPLGLAVVVVALLLVPPAAATSGARTLPGGGGAPVNVPPSSTRSSENVTNARHWIEVNQSSGPIPPSGGATAYDPQLGGLVLFGGASWSSGADGYLNSTWLFRSGGWTELCDGTTFNRSCPTAPPAREDAEMTYDTARQEMLLFGGIGSLDSEYTMFGDTWALRNSTWLRLQATFTAGPLIDSFDGTLVNDPSAGFALLELPYQPSGDTSFKFENSSWVRAPELTAPSDVVYYDPSIGTIAAASPTASGPTFHLGSQGWVASGRARSPFDNTSAELLGASFDSYAGEELALVSVYNFTGENWTLESRTLALSRGNWTDLDPGIEGSGPYPVYTVSADENYSALGGFTFDPSMDAAVLLLVNSTVTDGPAPTSQSTWALTEPLSVNLTVSASQTDVEISVSWALTASGGYGSIGANFVSNALAGCTDHAPSLGMNCTYSLPGTYEVQGFGTDGVGDSDSATASVIVHARPQALGTSAEAATTIGAPVSFVGRWSNGTAPFTGTWSFGDGSQGTSSDPIHAYTAPGSYTATWAVEDAVGATAADTVVIVVNPELAVDASVGRVITDAGLPDRFSTHIVGGTYPDAVVWEFGDGASSTAPNASYAFPVTGEYVATVQVTDYVGVTADSRVYVDVNPAMVIAAGANLTTVSAGAPLIFAAGAVGGTAPYTYLWRLGDGGWSSAPTFVHVFQTPGEYGVSVEVNDSGGSSQQDQFLVEVLPAPAAPPPSQGPPSVGGSPIGANPPSVFPRLVQHDGSTAPVALGDAILLAGVAGVLVIAAGSAFDRVRLARAPRRRRRSVRGSEGSDHELRLPPRSN